jgi:hypothetical protein
MPDQDDVRRLALALPETSEGPDSFRFLVAGKGFAWVWLERETPKGRRIANPAVLAVRVANEGEKDALLSLDQAVFFTEPHYDGFPAVLVRLDAVDLDLLNRLLTDAWRCQAPKRLARTFDST